MIDQYKDQFTNALEHLKQELRGLRTGRATPVLVEDLVVEAYSIRQPLKALAAITVTDPKTLAVEPWDKSLLKSIETAMAAAGIGLNPINDGRLLRLPLPELTQERRQELIKVLHKKLEDGRIAIRQIREEVRRGIDSAEKNKEISEDEKYREQETLEKMVKEYNEKIKVIGEEKEKEINTV